MMPTDDPMAPDLPPNLQQYQERSLLALLICICVAGPFVSLGVYLRDGVVPLTGVGIALTLCTYGLLLLYLKGPRQLVATLLIYLLIIAAGAATAAHGSVRSAATLVLMVAVVGAGVLLSRRAMIISAVLSIVLLGVLNLAENAGMLPTPTVRTGWAIWITQSVVLISLAVTVNFGRRHLLDAYRRQHVTLEHAREVEHLLRLSQARFQALFRSTPAATLVQRLPAGEVIDVNDAFIRMFGHNHAELLGRTSPNFWARPSERQAFRDALQRDGRVHNLQARGVRENGETFDVRVYSEIVHDGAEQIVITMVLDVSAETASRRALEVSEERFSKAFNFSPLGMTITRLSDGRFMEVNPANERVLGYTRADFEGRTATEAGVWVDEADRRAFVHHLQAQGGRLEQYETRMRSKAGRVVPVRIWSETIEIDGEPCALAFTLNMEADKHREALLLEMAQGVSGATGEAFFRSLVTHLARTLEADVVLAGELDTPETVQSVAAWSAGDIVPNLHYPIANTPSAQALGVASGCHFVGQLHRDNPNDLAPIDEGCASYLGMALRDEDGSPIGILKALWKNPRPLTPDMQAQMTIYASRCTAELLRLRRDREIRKLQDTLEQRVQARTAQLEYLNRELDSFAYTVSHDLKSPLRSIDGFSHLLREQMDARLDDDDRDMFDRIDTSVQRMSSLITDLLALARVSQGSLQRMDVNLSELADDVIRQERHRDPTRIVQVKIAPGLKANCDARMAHIVLENLLGNAWKYTRHQPAATIELGAAQRPPGQPAVFFVRDNGAGFDMARAERLFKPFNRLHAASEFEGSGVGLATVRRILERHGGHIRGEGEVGKGSVFEFSFGATD